MENDKIEVLNRFMGWESKKVFCKSLGRYNDVAPFDPYADTSEAREWTLRILTAMLEKGYGITTGFRSSFDDKFHFQLLTHGVGGGASATSLKDAILDAIYEAIKQSNG